MRDEEGALDVAAVRILALAVEDLLVVLVVVQVDGPVERQQNNLRNLFSLKFKEKKKKIMRKQEITQ